MDFALGTGLLRRDAQVPAFSLDLQQAGLDSRLSFARASTATDFVGGSLVTIAADSPRISAANGLLIEESRTNSLRNSSTSGAVAGSSLPTNWTVEVSGGLTTDIVAVGNANGFSYMRLRLSGTPTGTSWQLRCESNSQIAASSGQSWSASLFHRLQAGALTNISSIDLRVVELNSSATFLAASEAALVPVASWNRALMTRTLSDATCAFVNLRLRASLTVGAAVDVTLDIAAPQLELGAFATSYIPTSGTAASRAPDLASLTVGSWFNSAEGTFFAEALSGYGFDVAAATSPRVVRCDGGSTAYHEFRRNAADGVLRAGTNTANVS